MLFVINPISGGADKKAAKDQIQHWWQANNISGKWLETTGQADARGIRQRLSEEPPDAVIACGGDGTINLVGQQLVGRNIPMGILPLGSANGLARDLGIPDNVAQALDVLKCPSELEMDALLINERYYCFHLADMGYNARLIQEFESGKARGKSGYARSFLRVAQNRPLAKYRLQTDQGSFKRRSVMAAFANARQYGTGAVVNPHGRLDDGRFELCLFLPWPRWYLLWMSLLFFIGKIDKSRYVKIVSCQQLDLQTDRPLPLQVDGEMIGNCTQASVKVVPEKVRVLVPRCPQDNRVLKSS